jgi:hypothetical protein
MPRQEAKVDLLPQKAGVVAEKDGARLVHRVRSGCRQRGCPQCLSCGHVPERVHRVDNQSRAAQLSDSMPVGLLLRFWCGATAVAAAAGGLGGATIVCRERSEQNDFSFGSFASTAKYKGDLKHHQAATIAIALGKQEPGAADVLGAAIYMRVMRVRQPLVERAAAAPSSFSAAASSSRDGSLNIRLTLGSRRFLVQRPPLREALPRAGRGSTALVERGHVHVLVQ